MNKFFDLFLSKKFEERFEKELDNVLNKSEDSLESYIEELAEHYTAIINKIAPAHHKVTIDPTNIRNLQIDGKTYDLDLCISHNQTKLHEHLCAIDALFADLSAEGMKLEDSINQTEVKLNQKKRN